MLPTARRLRLLLAIGIYQPEGGGASEWLRNYALWLVDHGHDVCVACERAETPVPGPCALLDLSASRHTKNSWGRAVALQNLVKDHPADIVHDTGCLLASDVFHPLMGSLIHNWYRQLWAYPLPMRLRRFWACSPAARCATAVAPTPAPQASCCLQQKSCFRFCAIGLPGFDCHSQWHPDASPSQLKRGPAIASGTGRRRSSAGAGHGQ